MTDAELLAQCHTVFPGHRARTPAEMFAAMGRWCEVNDIAHDTYGNGALIQDFEAKVATLLGAEAAVFCISGTMAQSIALRLACEDRGSRMVALHPTSHIYIHEKSNYQLLHAFDGLQVGDRHRPWTVDDLAAVPDRLGAIGMEVPMREIGGQNPTWEQLDAIKAHAKARGAHLHMDGARLFEAAAGYNRSAKDVAQGFDSVYISLYKGIGGLGGSMLAGSADFIARATEWIRRQGGNVYQRSPYIVAAAMQFEQRLEAIPGCFARTLWLVEELLDYPQIKVNPARPQANMLHLHLPVGRERAIAIRNQLAQEKGIWMFGRAEHGALPATSVVELYVGDNLTNMDNDKARAALADFAALLAT